MSVLALFVVYTVWREGSNFWDKYTARKAEEKKTVLEANSASLAAIAALSESMKAGMALDGDTNKLLAGTIKACESIAASALTLKEEIGAFRKLLVKNESAYPEDNIIQPASDEQADLAAMTFANILRGRSPEEAVQEAKDAAEKKMMVSSISMGPME